MSTALRYVVIAAFCALFALGLLLSAWAMDTLSQDWPKNWAIQMGLTVDLNATDSLIHHGEILACQPSPTTDPPLS